MTKYQKHTRGLYRLFFIISPPIYLLLLLYPYNLELPGKIANTTEISATGGIVFPGPGRGIAHTSEAPRWLPSVITSQQLELILRIRSFSSAQFGPARIFTISENPYRRNFTVGQQNDALILRMRTPSTDLNGLPRIVKIPGVFNTVDWVDLRIVIEPRILTIQIGDNIFINKNLPNNAFHDWDPTHRLALGNELTCERPWRGEISNAIIRTGTDIEIDYTSPNSLVIPSRFWCFHQTPVFLPLQQLILTDAVKNFVLFLPVGLILGLLGNKRGRSWHILLIIFSTSISAEILQLLVPSRYPSINDVIFNTIGGGIGILVAKLLFRYRNSALYQ